MPGGLNPRISLARRLGGILSTAGDVVFVPNRTRLIALDARNGSQLWDAELGGQIVAGAISYEIDGVQYVAVAAGRSIFAFRLPEMAP